MEQIKGIRRKYPLFIVTAIFLLVAIFAFSACDDLIPDEIIPNTETPQTVVHFILGDTTVDWSPNEAVPDPKRDGYEFVGWFEDDRFQKSVPDISAFIHALSAGEYFVYAKYEEFPPEEQEPDVFKDVVYDDETVVYDGNLHSLTVKNVPEGTTVRYDCEGYVNAGTYDIYATLSLDDNERTIMATLNILRAEVDESRLLFDDKTVVWDGEKHSLSIEGELPEGITVQYVNSSDKPIDEGYSEVGEYLIIAKFSADMNHIAPSPKTAKLTILNRKYNITFKKLDGTEETVEIYRGDYLADYLPQNSQKDGYKIVWDHEKEEKVIADKTVEEVATAIRYALNFDGSGAPANSEQKTTYTIEEEVELLPVQKPYFEFVGWYENGNFEGEPTKKIAPGNFGDKNYAAKFDPIVYTVKYVPGKGANSVNNVNNGDEYQYTALSDDLKLADPYAIGYKFSGWFVGDEKVEVISAASPRDMTLVARYELINYTIHYETNGGSDPQNCTKCSVESENFTLKPSIRLGYEFLGWFIKLSENNELQVKAINDLPFCDMRNVDECTLYAKWEIVKYNIVYDPTGGENPKENPTTYDIDTQETTLLPAVRRGYKFDGWFNESGRVDKIGGGFDEEPPASMTLTAQWSLIEYNVDYRDGSDDGKHYYDIGPANYDVKDGNIALNSPSRTGYTFAGWFAGSAAGKKVSSFDDVPLDKFSDGKIVLYAVWEKKVYKIQYNLNLGEAPTDNPTAYDVDTEQIVLKPATRTGYKFLGWFDDRNSGHRQVEVIGGSSITEDTPDVLHLTANWEKMIYTIKYSCGDGGENPDENPSSFDIDAWDERVFSPATRTGYKFGGWYYLLNGGKTKVTKVKDLPLADVELVAEWSLIMYEVEYVCGDGGTNHLNNPKTYHVEMTDSPALQRATRRGYDFVGWYLSLSDRDNEKIELLKNVPLAGIFDGKIVLYARWNLHEYEIHYALEDGAKNDENNPQKFNVVTPYIELKPAIKEGYKFVGWYADKDGGEQKVEGVGGESEKTEQLADLYLTARFEIIRYTIEYDCKGGTTNPENPTEFDVEHRNFELKPAIYAGREFLCWYITLGSEDANIKNINELPLANITLFARWNIASYDITYDLGEGGVNGNNPSKFTVDDKDSIVLNPPTRLGYTFEYWYYLQDGEEVKTYDLKNVPLADLQLIAKWTIINYTISYNCGSEYAQDGGNPKTYNVEMTVGLILNDAICPGYDFTGWYATEACDKNRVYSLNKSLIKVAALNVITLYADWAVHNYKITYDVGDGKNVANPTSFSVENKADITLQAPSRTGYTFEYWYYLQDEKEVKISDLKDVPLADLKLFAKWSATEYSVQYSGVDNCTSNGDNPTQYSVDDPNIKLKPAVRLGYNFNGWYLSADGNGQKINNLNEISLAEINGSTITLYAKWDIVNYAITYECNCDNATDGGNPSTYNVTMDDVNLQPATRYGYDFMGWYLSEGCDGQQIAKLSKQLLENVDDDAIALYASWKATEYTVTFVNNGEVGEQREKLSYTIEDCPLTIADGIEAEGYTFAGWYEDDAFSGEPVKTITADNLKNYVLYCRYDKVQGGEDHGSDEHGGDSGSDEDEVAAFKQKFTVTEDDNGYTITGYNIECGNEVVIPASVGGKKVVAIAEGAFGTIDDPGNFGTITSLDIQAELTVLPQFLFYNLALLQKLVLPATLTKLDDGCLKKCVNLIDLTIPFVGLQPYHQDEWTADYYAGFAILFAPESDYDPTVNYEAKLYYYDFHKKDVRQDPYGWNDKIRCIPISLKSVTILGGDIIRDAFCGLKFSSVHLFNCKNIDLLAFEECTQLAEIEIDKTIQSLHQNALYDLTALEKVIIHDEAIMEQLQAALKKTNAANGVTIELRDDSGAVLKTYQYVNGGITGIANPLALQAQEGSAQVGAGRKKDSDND